jgi:hypothetical protein
MRKSIGNASRGPESEHDFDALVASGITLLKFGKKGK